MLTKSSDKIIKKSLKIGSRILGTVFILLLVCYFILQSPEVQTFLVGKITKQLSAKYHTNITVKGVSIAFFNKVVLNDVLVKDQNDDSLLFVHELVANINSFKIKEQIFRIDKLELDKTFLNVTTDSVGTPNYQFLVNLLSTKDTLKTDSLKSGNLQFDFKLKRFDFKEATVKYAYRDNAGNHLINLRNINLGVSDLELNNEKVAFLVDHFQLNDQKLFVLDDFSAQFVAVADSINLTKLHVKTSNSEITEANVSLSGVHPGSGFDFSKMKVNLDLKKSKISLKDVGMIVPELKGMEENIDVSGQVTGTLGDLKGKNIALSMGNNTQLAFDIYLSGLPDITSTYLHVNLKQSFADFNDLSKVKLPDNFPLKQVAIPSQLLDAGIIEYNGNFTGFLSDFVAYGTFKTKWGMITTDLSFVPSQGDRLKINGKLKTVNFKIGELFQSDLLDGITFNGDIQGVLNQQTHDFSAKVSGNIDSMKVNNYQYNNIQMNGEVQNKQFNGRMTVDDPNLKFKFDGKFDFNVPVPVFNFEMLMEKADLKALNLDPTSKKSEISFALDANFTGNNIDNLDGFIHFSKGNYQNENDNVSFDEFNLKTFNNNGPVLQVRSDFLDADIHGNYQLYNLHNSVKEIIAHYLPSLGLTFPNKKSQNNFDFKFVLKDINRFTRVFLPELKMNSAELSGSINSDKNTLTVNATFPEIKYQTAVFHKFTLNVEGNSSLNIRNKVAEFDLGDQFKMYNLSLISGAEDDVLDSKLVWNNFDAVSYSGSLSTSTKFFRQKNTPHIEISVKPSRIYLADSLWQVNSSVITVDSTRINVDKLKLSNKGQYILADGLIDKNQTNKLNIQFNKIDLNSMNNIVTGDMELKGELNGNMSVLDIYHRALYLADLKINGLSLIGQLVGDASIQSRWDTEAEEIDAELLVKSDNRQTLLASGIFNPARDSISINTNFDHFSLAILQPLLGSTFANFHGDATGKVRVYGHLDEIQHDGALFASNAGLMLTDLQVNYNLNDSVRFSGNKIIFPKMKIADNYGNTGIFDGTIQHQSFGNMIYDLSVKTDKKIMVFNTTPVNNEQFYGKLFASGTIKITGTDNALLISGVARTEKGTDMNIYLEYTGQAEEYDFLTFIKHGFQLPEKVKMVPVTQSTLLMKFNVEITPEAKAQLIYNSKIGDVIRGQGKGNLQIDIDNNSNVSLYGDFTVEQGDYLFTFQNIINKKFEIQEGGTIQWNGEPDNAIIDLNAIYRLKASLKELFVNSYDNVDLTQRIPVVCKIALTKNLSNPDIKFDIDFPTIESRIKDEVRQFINSEEDMNKQIFTLLVMGKFYTPDYLRGSYVATNNNLVGSTASELASNQLSNWLSQWSKNFDVGVNYRPGNQMSNDEIEVALSTQLFNDRVSINGNLANNGAQKTGVNNNGLVGDADVNVKLTRNGKLQFKAYNHANNNLIYETSPYTQGVGVSYREDFNNIEELWQKMKSIFKRKTKQAIPKNAGN